MPNRTTKPGMQRGRHLSPLAKMRAATNGRTPLRGVSAHILYALLSGFSACFQNSGFGLRKGYNHRFRLLSRLAYGLH